MDINTVPYVRGYDLGSINPYYGVLDVLISPWPTYNAVDNLDWKRIRWRESSTMPTSDFPSGNGIIVAGISGLTGGDVPIWNVNGVTTTLHVTYAAPFDTDIVASDAETTTLGADIGLDGQSSTFLQSGQPGV